MSSIPVIDNAMLTTIVGIAKQAGHAILTIYQEQDFGVQTKGDNSPLTKADIAAHKIIIAQLQKHFPQIPVISEESDEIDFEERRHWKVCFMVDPLDGTKEFINRNDEFTVNIALIIDGEPKLGVIYAPVLKTCYYAAEKIGAFKKIDAQTAQSIKTRKLPTKHNHPFYSIIASRRHGFEAVETLSKKMRNFELVTRGSSLKMCLIAEGKADFYPRLAPTCEWDTAAAQPIVEEAGGALLQLDFNKLTYNQKRSFLNPHFLVVGDLSVDWCSFFTGDSSE